MHAGGIGDDGDFRGQCRGSAVPETTDSPLYDDDGNLTHLPDISSGVTSNYTYNAENRLIKVEPETPVEGNKKLEFVYDYMGRRVEKKVYEYSSSAWVLNSDSLFLYDDWNLIEAQSAVSGQPSATTYYIWGLDLSQSLQGAGGTGGLLASIQDQASSIHLFCYDANGNVGQLVDASDGSIDAQYEYDPFGNATVLIGDEADDNPFRFSAKYYDPEVELYYYGYRYYSPALGRWVNRDPIGEPSGLNLYNFVINDPINQIDTLGQYYNEPSLTYPVGYYDYNDLLVSGQAQQQINSFQDALSHYRSGRRGVIPAGPGLYAEMRAHSSYKRRVAGNNSWVAGQIRLRLRQVPKNQTTGTFSNAPSSFVGQLQSTTLGSYGLFIHYNLTWNSGPWKPRWHSFITGGCYREVSSNVTVNFNNVTDWNFNWNPQYNWFENITRETIPGWIAGARGNPAGFFILLNLSEMYNLKAEQDL